MHVPSGVTRLMFRIRTARPILGLAVLVLCTLLCVALVDRLGGPVLAFVSSPLFPLPTPRLPRMPILPWARVLSIGLISIGVVLVVVGWGWLRRLRR